MSKTKPALFLPNFLFLTRFVERLRKAGIPISISQNINFTKSIEVIMRGQKQEEIKEGSHFKELYWAGKTSLLSHPSHLLIYDKIFESYFNMDLVDFLKADQGLTYDYDDENFDEIEDIDTQDDQDDQEIEQEILSVRYSATETLYKKDFDKLSKKELNQAKQIISQMKMSAPLKTSRRLKSSKIKSTHLDIQKTVRLAIQTDGEPIRKSFLKPSLANRKIVMLLDISGSMETYARVMLHFAHSVITSQKNISQKKVEIFTLSTSLTRITKELLTKDPDLALTQVSNAVKDWSGGTKLGQGLQDFNNQWGVKGMARGAVVLILSDGWDRGETQKLGEQMARLSRVAHKIIWVNPLKASKDYEPLAQGMKAALPWIDDFVEGHSLFALKKLAGLIAGLTK